MRHNKTMSMKSFKIIVQRIKALNNYVDSSGWSLCSCREEIQVQEKAFIRLSKMFHIDPIVTQRSTSEYPFEYAIYIEGVRVFCISTKRTTKFTSSWTEDQFNYYNKLCFEFENNKEVAFEEFKNRYKYGFFKYITSHAQLERLFRKKMVRTYETLYNEYQEYKRAWTDDDEEPKKYGDYYRPLTLREFLKENS